MRIEFGVNGDNFVDDGEIVQLAIYLVAGKSMTRMQNHVAR
jgi:hypothetical protein